MIAELLIVLGWAVWCVLGGAVTVAGERKIRRILDRERP